MRPDLGEGGRDEDSERSDEGEGALHFADAECESSSPLFIGRRACTSVPIRSPIRTLGYFREAKKPSERRCCSLSCSVTGANIVGSEPGVH